jgi:tetratricopeptide (TPR) repeat protein
LVVRQPNSHCEGKEYDESGKEYKAAQKYIAALEINENHRKAALALAAVAEDAYKEKLALAETAEHAGDFARALTEYRELQGYIKDLEAFDVLGFSPINTRSKIEEMANAAAEDRYKKAEAHFANRAWEDAITEYKAAQGFKDGYKDTAQKIASASYSWAEDDLKTNRFRAAAEHFREAAESGGAGYKDATYRAGTIYAALGRHFISADRCRQSVRDLRQAQSLLGPGKVDTYLAQGVRMSGRG